MSAPALRPCMHPTCEHWGYRTYCCQACASHATTHPTALPSICHNQRCYDRAMQIAWDEARLLKRLTCIAAQR